VAGPLRETAAFAATESDPIAEWVTDHDPEVIGLSDVADEALRRRATMRLLEKFRRHDLTDAQIIRDGIPLAGFQYPGAEEDLRPVLQERSDGCQDVLECAVNLIASWNLGSMGDDLAGLVLDPIAPLEARKAAAYALVKVGTREARSRLRPLIEDHPDDPDFDLKGLALRCNWPDGLTVDELLHAITPPRTRNYHGAYAGFLLVLDHERFDARGHRGAGLRWARPFVRQDLDYDSAGRIAKRIAIASLDEIDDPGIAAALADLLLEAAESYGGAPLTPPHRYDWAGEEPEERTAMLDRRPSVRRKLLAAIATRASKDSKLWWAAREAPGLLVADDFPWLLERAVDSALPMPEREAYAELARMLPWGDRVDCIEAWLAVREIEPVASRLPHPLSMKLDSPEAALAKKGFAEMNKRHRKPRRKKLRHPMTSPCGLRISWPVVPTRRAAKEASAPGIGRDLLVRAFASRQIHPEVGGQPVDVLGREDPLVGNPHLGFLDQADAQAVRDLVGFPL
jgi:hypothetical protein